MERLRLDRDDVGRKKVNTFGNQGIGRPTGFRKTGSKDCSTIVSAFFMNASSNSGGKRQLLAYEEEGAGRSAEEWSRMPIKFALGNMQVFITRRAVKGAVIKRDESRAQLSWGGGVLIMVGSHGRQRERIL